MNICIKAELYFKTFVFKLLPYLANINNTILVHLTKKSD